MTRVLVLKDWSWLDHRQHTPGGSGVWDGITFTEDAALPHEYVVVMNRVPQKVTVHCPPEHIWGLTQEPPVPEYHWLREGFSQFYQVFTPDVDAPHPRIIPSHGALPWHAGKSYDELRAMSPPHKTRPLSWVTSSKTGRAGHQQRLAFLEQLQQQVDFDLYGRGFQPIESKWDGLAPYRYTLAVENHSAPYYWTEKLADAFLAWSMPIYYGCTNITQYFPEEALIRIDITRPQEAIATVQEAIHSDVWRTRRDAIHHAREQVLEQYHFFPFIAGHIRQWEQAHSPSPAQTIQLRQLVPPHKRRAARNPLQRVLRSIRRRFRG